MKYYYQRVMDRWMYTISIRLYSNVSPINNEKQFLNIFSIVGTYFNTLHDAILFHERHHHPCSAADDQNTTKNFRKFCTFINV